MKMGVRNAVLNVGIQHRSLFNPKSSVFTKATPPPHLLGVVGLGRLLFPRHSIPIQAIPIPIPGFGYATRFRGVQVRGISSNPVTSSSKGKGEGEGKDREDTTPNWKIKMLYDGECPLCMREVDMLRQRNKQFQTISFVDISCDNYSPAENQDVDYRAAMGRIHAILADGTVVTDVEAFRKLYEAVNLGWVYAVTKYEPIATVANSVYGVWAKYRLQVTGRPPLEEVIEAKLKKKAETCGNKDACKM